MSEFKQLSDDALEKTPALKAEYDIIQAKIDAQKMQNVTQKEETIQIAIECLVNLNVSHKICTNNNVQV